QNLNYLEVTHLRPVRFFGETVQTGEGRPNPWMVVGQLSLALLFIFAADASIAVWRRGERHRAITVGGSTVLFMLFGTAQSVFVFWGLIEQPIVATLSFMGLVGVMGYELSSEILQASQLGRKLQESEAGLHESEERMRLAVEAADFGVLVRDFGQNAMWGSERW